MSRFKTELCNNLIELGTCKYGDRCHYAHGAHELRQVSRRHPKYRTERCKNFELTGKCPFGPRCSYVHPKPDLDSMIEQLTRYLKHTTAPKPDFEDHDKEEEKVQRQPFEVIINRHPLFDNQLSLNNHHQLQQQTLNNQADLQADQENHPPQHNHLIISNNKFLEPDHLSLYPNANPKRIASNPFGISRKPLSDVLNINTQQAVNSCRSPLKRLTNN